MDSPQVRAPAPRLPWAAYGYALAASLASFAAGYGVGVVAPAILFVRSTMDPAPGNTETALLVSVLLLGAVFGALAAGAMSDRWGRVPVLVWTCAAMAGGALVSAFASAPAVLLAGRAGLGVAVGIAGVASTLYVADISPPSVRGGLCVLSQTLGAAGAAAAALVGCAAARMGTEDALCWRYALASGAVPALFAAILMHAVLPEAPGVLLSRGRARDAAEVLLAVYGRRHEAALVAHYQLLAERASYREPRVLRRRDFRRKHFGAPLGRVFVLQAAQQLSGTPALLGYAALVFHALRLTKQDAALYNALAYLPQLVVSASLLVLISGCGRRVPLLLSQGGVVLSLVLLGLASLVRHDGNRMWAMLGGLALHRCAFALGLGPLPCAVSVEVLPYAVRTRGLAFSGAVGWALALLGALSFPGLFAAVGAARVFWAYAALSLALLFVVARCVPETHGVSLPAPQAAESPRAAEWLPDDDAFFDLL